MTYTTTGISNFLAVTPPFNFLSSAATEQLSEKSQPLRYRMGQAITVRETMPAEIAILYEGQARLLGYAPTATVPVTLQLLNRGAIIGWASLIRGVACETAIASTEATCLTIPATDFLALLELEPQLADIFRNHCALIEAFDLLSAEMERQANAQANLKELAIKAHTEAVILNIPTGKTPLQQLDPNLVWLLSGGAKTNFSVGERLTAEFNHTHIKVEGTGSARLVGFQPSTLLPGDASSATSTLAVVESPEIPYAPERPAALETKINQVKNAKYPYVHGRGPVNATLACFQMLSQQLGMPFKRDVLKRALINSFERNGSISLQLCGAITELISLKSQLLDVPAVAVSRLPVPAMLKWQDSFALLYSASEKELIVAIPETGIQHIKPAALIEAWGESGQVLLLQPTTDTPKQQFGLSWFLPSPVRYRKVLLEVLIASLFVQLFGLANPLITQVIIDKVLVQNSISTLNVLGIFLIVIAVFEAVITSIRTNLFVDTTNRIDLALGAQVIDHLLRLPLRYFERRPIGELSTRVNELENIRQFLTGTALTVVLDAIFSVIYIAVMVFYSPLLTVVALATVPLFAALTFICAPIICQQSRTKAERNADTQSYLVEVVSGIQTVRSLAKIS